MMKRLVLLILIALSGCATTPIGNNEASNIPVDRTLAPEMQRSFPDAAVLTIKRDTGFMGSGCTMRLFIDGKPVADLRKGEKFKAYVNPGRHMLGVTPAGFCGGGTAETETTLSKNESRSYRISSGQDGTLGIHATAF